MRRITLIRGLSDGEADERERGRRKSEREATEIGEKQTKGCGRPSK